MNQIDTFMKVLKQKKANLTRQQLLTLKGQALAGDISGSYEGLAGIMRRNHGNIEPQDHRHQTVLKEPQKKR